MEHICDKRSKIQDPFPHHGYTCHRNYPSSCNTSRQLADPCFSGHSHVHRLGRRATLGLTVYLLGLTKNTCIILPANSKFSILRASARQLARSTDMSSLATSICESIPRSSQIIPPKATSRISTIHTKQSRWSSVSTAT